jgi:glycosyltransferase involved in cell wall biosynthesis
VEDLLNRSAHCIEGLVSVIVPCYNHAEHIKEALDSVLSQSYRNIEIIVVDDGSTDNLREVLAPYLQHKKIVCFYQQNKGLSAARNAGLKIAQGEFVKFLDSDDFLYPEQIERQVTDLRSHSGGLSVSRFSLLLPSGKLTNKSVPMEPPHLQYASFIENNRGGGIHSFLIRKCLVDAVGGFDETLKACEDLDLCVRILRSGHYVTVVDYVGCCYRILDKSMSNQTESMFIEKCKVYEKINGEFIDNPQHLTAEIGKRLLIVNPKLIYESIARGKDRNRHLSNTMKMTHILYGKTLKGLDQCLAMLLGIAGYSKYLYLKTNCQDPQYKDRLLNGEVTWKYR